MKSGLAEQGATEAVRVTGQRTARALTSILGRPCRGAVGHTSVHSHAAFIRRTLRYSCIALGSPFVRLRARVGRGQEARWICGARSLLLSLRAPPQYDDDEKSCRPSSCSGKGIVVARWRAHSPGGCGAVG